MELLSTQQVADRVEEETGVALTAAEVRAIGRVRGAADLGGRQAWSPEMVDDFVEELTAEPEEGEDEQDEEEDEDLEDQDQDEE